MIFLLETLSQYAAIIYLVIATGFVVALGISCADAHRRSSPDQQSHR